MSLEQSLATLLQRLDQATARLETVEKALASGVGAAAPAAAAAAPAASGAAVNEFQALLDSHINNFVALSNKLAPEVGKQAAELVLALQATKNLIGVASQSKKPASDAILALIQPINQHAQVVETLRSSNRTSKFFNNLSAVSESIGFLSWVVVEPTPGPHVAEMKSSAEFYTNRILKEFKGVNQDQVDWVQAYNGFLVELQKYIKQYHTTGLSWNAKGGVAPTSAPAVAAPSGGAPPPPPAG
eukprot:gene16699-19852_t